MEQRGYYRLNTKNNPDAQQLMLDFKEHSSEEEKEEKPQQDLSLDLFGWKAYDLWFWIVW